jgi:hypothetical protein
MTPITPAEAETILSRYIADGYAAVRERADDAEELRCHLHFLAGSLHGCVTAKGLDATAAHRLVRRFFAATQACFEAESDSVIAEKRSLN